MGKKIIKIETIAIIIALIKNKYVNSKVMEYISDIKNTEIGPDPNARINLIPYTTPWYFWGVNLPSRRFSVGRILALNTAARIHKTTKE